MGTGKAFDFLATKFPEISIVPGTQEAHPICWVNEIARRSGFVISEKLMLLLVTCSRVSHPLQSQNYPLHPAQISLTLGRENMLQIELHLKAAVCEPQGAIASSVSDGALGIPCLSPHKPNAKLFWVRVNTERSLLLLGSMQLSTKLVKNAQTEVV